MKYKTKGIKKKKEKEKEKEKKERKKKRETLKQIHKDDTRKKKSFRVVFVRACVRVRLSHTILTPLRTHTLTCINTHGQKERKRYKNQPTNQASKQTNKQTNKRV